MTLMSASTGMKFVSPFQRGTTWRWAWSTMPAPATRPRFQPTLKPSGAKTARSVAIASTASRCVSSASASSRSSKRRAVPVRRDHQVARGVRELVEQDEGELAPVDHELRLVLRQRRGATEDALVVLVRVLDVLEPPRRPQPLHAAEATSASEPCSIAA